MREARREAATATTPTCQTSQTRERKKRTSSSTSTSTSTIRTLSFPTLRPVLPLAFFEIPGQSKHERPYLPTQLIHGQNAMLVLGCSTAP